VCCLLVLAALLARGNQYIYVELPPGTTGRVQRSRFAYSSAKRINALFAEVRARYGLANIPDRLYAADANKKVDWEYVEYIEFNEETLDDLNLQANDLLAYLPSGTRASTRAPRALF